MGCFWWTVVQKAKPKMTSYKVLRETFIRNITTANYLKVAWLFRKSCCWLVANTRKNIWIFPIWITFKKRMTYFSSKYTIFSVTFLLILYIFMSYCFRYNTACYVTCPQVPKNFCERNTYKVKGEWDYISL